MWFKTKVKHTPNILPIEWICSLSLWFWLQRGESRLKHSFVYRRRCVTLLCVTGRAAAEASLWVSLYKVLLRFVFFWVMELIKLSSACWKTQMFCSSWVREVRCCTCVKWSIVSVVQINPPSTRWSCRRDQLLLWWRWKESSGKVRSLKPAFSWIPNSRTFSVRILTTRCH